MVGAAVTRRAWLRPLYYRLIQPEFPSDTSAGPLRPHALQTLVSATETILGKNLNKSRYEDFFRWYAENIRGYKVFYEGFTDNLDNKAKWFGVSDFIGSDEAVKRRILEMIFQNRKGRLQNIRAGIFERNGLLAYNYFRKPILILFSKTDAWILLGYASWPGTPRGLDKYTNAPLKAKKVSSYDAP